MNPSLVRAALKAGLNRELRHLAQAFLQGEDTARYPMMDLLEELQWSNKMELTIGQCYLITTVTFYWLGEVAKCTPTEVVLKNASWVPDTGRFSTALTEGTTTELEPVPDSAVVHLNQLMILAAVQWQHELPREAR